MTSWAALLSSIAAILNALAWPCVVLWFLITHRKRIASLLKIIGGKFSTANKWKLGAFEMETIQSEMEDAVVQAGVQTNDDNLGKSIPPSQVAAAKRLSQKFSETNVPDEAVLESVRQEIYRLASEYEIVRETIPSGYERTRKMNEIAAGMRTLAIAALRLRTELTRSDSVGRRLAAICIL